MAHNIDLSVSPRAKPTLLTIPAELRRQIYRLVCVEQRRLIVRKQTSNDDSNQHRLSIGHPELMLTCRTIFNEAREIYYTENTFSFDHNKITPGAIRTFERLCGPHADRITMIRVSHWVHAGRPARTRFDIQRTQAELAITGIFLKLPYNDNQTLLGGDEEYSGDLIDLWKSRCNTCLKTGSRRLAVVESTARNPIFEYLEAYLEDCRPAWKWGEVLEKRAGYEVRKCKTCYRPYYIRDAREPALERGFGSLYL